MLAQSAQANAKEDTVLLLLASNLTDDLAQFNQDLTANGLGSYRTSFANGAITGETGRDIYYRGNWNIGADINVVLCIHADPAAIGSCTWAIILNASGHPAFVQGGVTLYTASDITGAGESDYSVNWSTRPNPDATGAGDAVISEVVVYNHTASTSTAPAQFTHAISATNTAWAVGYAGFWNGAALVSSLNGAHALRVSRAWHPMIEVFEDWVAARTAAPADATALACLLPLTTANAGDGQWTGSPNIGFVAEHNARQRRAMWGALVNDVYHDAEFFGRTNDPVPWVRLAPSSTLYEMRIDWLRWVAPPAGATHAWVRIHLVSYVTAGAAVPIKLRMYAMNRPEELSLQAYPSAPAFTYTYAESALLTVDNTVTGTGQWLDLGLLRLPTWDTATPGFVGTVHLCPAYSFDPAGTSANDANARIKIRAVHARAMFRPQANVLGE